MIGSLGDMSDFERLNGFDNGQTDGRTDRQTDRRTFAILESLSRLKTYLTTFKVDFLKEVTYFCFYLIKTLRKL